MKAQLNPKALIAVNAFQLYWHDGQQIADREKSLQSHSIENVDTAIDQ